jgi:hypothetical protein
MLLNCIGYETSNERTSVNRVLEGARWYGTIMAYFNIIKAITHRDREEMLWALVRTAYESRIRSTVSWMRKSANLSVFGSHLI